MVNHPKGDELVDSCCVSLILTRRVLCSVFSLPKGLLTLEYEDSFWSFVALDRLLYGSLHLLVAMFLFCSDILYS